MGLFDFFKPKSQDFSIKISTSNENGGASDTLEKKLARIRQENKSWEQDFKSLIRLRERAAQLEKSGKYSDAIEMYLRAICFGESSNQLNFSNYVHDVERVIVLYGKSKQKEEQRLFLKKVIGAYPDFTETKKWIVRLSKLEQDDSVNIKLGITHSDIKVQEPGCPTIGQKIQNFKDNLPEFNFYFDLPEGMKTFEYLYLKKPVPFDRAVELRKYRDVFDTILSKAKIAENDNNLIVAIEAYEKLVVEEYEMKEPYERLMIIYRRLKWYDEEKRITMHAIHFFETLRKNQKEKTLNLAKKYGMENKALKYIEAGKRIQYYGGAFDLYNPYSIIEKWKKNLEKNIK